MDLHQRTYISSHLVTEVLAYEIHTLWGSNVTCLLWTSVLHVSDVWGPGAPLTYLSPFQCSVITSAAFFASYSATSRTTSPARISACSTNTVTSRPSVIIMLVYDNIGNGSIYKVTTVCPKLCSALWQAVLLFIQPTNLLKGKAASIIHTVILKKPL